MNERQVYPEWLDTDEDMLAEKISEIEAELPDSNDEFKRLYEEKHELLEANPTIRSILDADKPVALSKEESEQLIRIIALDNRMREITDRAIFVYGRKNAYMFPEEHRHDLKVKTQRYWEANRPPIFVWKGGYSYGNDPHHAAAHR